MPWWMSHVAPRELLARFRIQEKKGVEEMKASREISEFNRVSLLIVFSWKEVKLGGNVMKKGDGDEITELPDF